MNAHTLPETGTNTSTMAGTTVISVENLHRVYSISKGMLRKPDLLQAVSGVSFTVQAGKTLAIVGES
ncbi:MAG: transporter ATP-binding protein, partial [Pseudomonadota bacterium]